MRRDGIDSEFYERVYEKPKYRSGFEKWLTEIQPILTSPYERLIEKMGNLNTKRVCEIGCGNGYLTSLLAKKGAIVYASDISPEAVEITRRLNINQYVDVRVMDACHLKYKDEFFDYVVGCGILHHVNLGVVTKEIKRVLKPNGIAYFDEPLVYNPIAKLWRKLTPSTKDINEYPLSYDEINRIGREFMSFRYSEYNLLPMLSSIAYVFTGSNKIKKSSSMCLAKMEPFVLKFKPLRRYCGSIQIEFMK